MVRRLFAGVVATALIASLFISSASAAASPAAVLRASFEGYLSGGLGASYATWIRGGQAWYHAASTGIDLEAGAARIGVYGTAADPQVHCSSNLFGIWMLIWDTDKAALEAASYQMSFGPLGGPLTPLAIKQTPVKRVVDKQGWWSGGDVPLWWQSVGVPVYSSLAPGWYEFYVAAEDPTYGNWEVDAIVHIVVC